MSAHWYPCIRAPYDRFESADAIIDERASLPAGPDRGGFLLRVVALPDGEQVPLAVEPSRLLVGVDGAEVA